MAPSALSNFHRWSPPCRTQSHCEPPPDEEIEETPFGPLRHGHAELLRAPAKQLNQEGTRGLKALA